MKFSTCLAFLVRIILFAKRLLLKFAMQPEMKRRVYTLCPEML